MAILKDILYGVRLEEVVGDTSTDITDLFIDSRQVTKDSLFAAITGTQTDGHRFISQAIDQGARAILCEEMPADKVEGVTYIRVPDSPEAIGLVADNFFGNPSSQLKAVAVTGTNGKTTVATLLHRLFLGLGYEAGLLSTVENKIGRETLPASHTTPDSISIHRMMARMVAAGCGHCFMEASSIALDQKRLAGVKLAGAVFTNITHDHLDYHKTFDAYIASKKQLFDQLPASAFALINLDDKRAKVMVQNSKANVYDFALKAPAEFKGKVLENSFIGLQIDINGVELHSRLIGHFNAYNLLAVYAVAVLLGEDRLEVLAQLSAITPAEGRFDYFISPGGVAGIIDYAHTPDALKNVLETIQAVRTGQETLVTVVGCGGDRDKTKRPIMAAVAARLSDKVILTADNPRSEDPQEIIAEMKAGVKPPLNRKLLTITNREEAIETAVQLVHSGDIILVAGKGHEKYQEVKGKRLPFDDKAILLNALKTAQL